MTRTCTRCQTPLSAYNQGTLCGPCEVAARQSSAEADIPLTFWFRPQVRAALARWEWGSVLSAVGAETKLSQTGLGVRVGLSQAQISRLMGGRSKEPGFRTVLGIVDSLGIPRLLAGLAPRGLDHLARDADDGTVTVDPVERRTLGKAIVAITLAIPLADTEPGQPVDVTRLTPNDVVADLYELDDRYGGAAIGDVARRMELGRNAEAADLLRSATWNRTYLRNGAYYSAVRARALVAAGAPDEATSVVSDTLPAFTEVTSARVFDELAQVRRGLEPYLADGHIAECADVIDGLVS